MRVTRRVVKVALVPGAVLVFLGAFSPMLRVESCGARAWQAAWHPEDLRITGDRTAAEKAAARAECHRGGERAIEDGARRAAVGAAVLAATGAGLGVAAAATSRVRVPAPRVGVPTRDARLPRAVVAGIALGAASIPVLAAALGQTFAGGVLSFVGITAASIVVASITSRRGVRAAALAALVGCLALVVGFAGLLALAARDL